jgi:hypothetical protein
VSLPRLWAFLAVALPTLAALVASLPSVDLAYHLRAGGEILATRAIPTADTWTFTAAGLPWTDQQWGSQVVLAAVHQLGGWTGLVVLRALLVAVIFGCLLEIGRRRGLGLRLSAWLALAAFIVSAAALGLRPQLLGMALFAVVLLLVVDRRAHPGRLWAIPLIVLAWANVHGSFFLGPLVLGLAWLEDLHDRVERPYRALLVAGMSAVAACITPFGPAVWAYAVGLSMNPEVTRRITEWQPTSLRDLPGGLFFVSALAVVVLIARRGRSTPWPTLVWLGVFFVVGAYAARGIAWWPLGVVAAIAGVLVAAPARAGAPAAVEPVGAAESAGAAGAGGAAGGGGARRMQQLNAVVAGAIVLAGVALLPVWRPVDPGLGAPSGVVSYAPSGTTAALRDLARPGDRLFNPQEWGAWFEFALPALPVAIDSRIEFFPVEVWQAYDAVATGREEWASQLDQWGVTIVVLTADEQAFLERLSAAGWQTVHTDADGSVLVAPGR